MFLTLDHVIIAVRDLETAVRDYQSLGFTVIRGGIHANCATQNALIVFPDGTYCELLAPTGESPVPGMIDFSVLLSGDEGLVGFALRSDDLDSEIARLREAGFHVGSVMPGERRRETGVVIQWRLVLLEDGFAPFLIQDVTPHDWRVPTDAAITLHPNRVVGIRGVELAVRDKKRPASLFGDYMILRETELLEGLWAVHLLFDGDTKTDFPVELTHGVRFQPDGFAL